MKGFSFIGGPRGSHCTQGSQTLFLKKKTKKKNKLLTTFFEFIEIWLILIVLSHEKMYAININLISHHENTIQFLFLNDFIRIFRF